MNQMSAWYVLCAISLCGAHILFNNSKNNRFNNANEKDFGEAIQATDISFTESLSIDTLVSEQENIITDSPTFNKTFKDWEKPTEISPTTLFDDFGFFNGSIYFERLENTTTEFFFSNRPEDLETYESNNFTSFDGQKKVTTHLEQPTTSLLNLTDSNDKENDYKITSKKIETKSRIVSSCLKEQTIIIPHQNLESVKDQGFAKFTNKSLLLILLNSDGLPCIKMIPEIMMMVYYRRNDFISNDFNSAAFFPRLPRKEENLTVDGYCNFEDKAFLRILWDGYILSWTFKKTLNMSWHINTISLHVNTKYDWFRNYGICVPLEETFYFGAQLEKPSMPLEHSYLSCEDIQIDLSYNEAMYNADNFTLSTFLYLKKDFQVQAFMDSRPQFGPFNECKK